MDELDILKELKRATNADNAALVSRDGLNLAAETSEGIYAETFSIMCATIQGAASTTNSELGKGEPRLIQLDSDDSKVLIAGAGPRAIIVLSVPKGSNVELIRQEIERAIPKFLSVL